MNLSNTVVFLRGAAIVTLLCASGCSTLWKSSPDGEQNAKSEAENTISPPSDLGDQEFQNLPIELKQARIMARLTELEDLVRQQKSRLAVLEKGLLLGIIPDELMNPQDVEYAHKLESKKNKKQKQSKQADNDGDKVADKTESKSDNKSDSTPSETNKDPRKFSERLLAAQDFFDSGRFGRAITEYEAIGRDFPTETADGSIYYWIGVSWFNLKEYDLARKALTTLINEHSSSAWVPRAKLNLAKIDARLGLKARASTAFQDIIKSHPNDEAAALARQELLDMEKKL